MKTLEEARWIAAFEFVKADFITSVILDFNGITIRVDRNLNITVEA